MNTEEIVAKAHELRKRIQSYKLTKGFPERAAKAQVCEFLRAYAGPKSAFVEAAEAVPNMGDNTVLDLSMIIQSFIEYLEAGLVSGVSPERKGQLDVVNDVLDQANLLLEDNSFHPAAAAIMIGVSLEQLLRSWVEAANVPLASGKPGIDCYCRSLKTADLISTQDVKDITAWTGIRNHAAHGEWEQVSDRGRIRLMLDGVNLFMRQKQS